MQTLEIELQPDPCIKVRTISKAVILVRSLIVASILATSLLLTSCFVAVPSHRHQRQGVIIEQHDQVIVKKSHRGWHNRGQRMEMRDRRHK
jgi:hypothetical protein